MVDLDGFGGVRVDPVYCFGMLTSRSCQGSQSYMQGSLWQQRAYQAPHRASSFVRRTRSIVSLALKVKFGSDRSASRYSQKLCRFPSNS